VRIASAQSVKSCFDGGLVGDLEWLLADEVDASLDSRVDNETFGWFDGVRLRLVFQVTGSRGVFHPSWRCLFKGHVDIDRAGGEVSQAAVDLSKDIYKNQLVVRRRARLNLAVSPGTGAPCYTREDV
jgi:hypothetical protein